MLLNWQGHGQKHYDFNDGYLRLEWNRIDGEMIYSLSSHRITRICSQGDGKCAFVPSEVDAAPWQKCPCYEPKFNTTKLLSFRIPDFSWQSSEPSFFNESVGNA